MTTETLTALYHAAKRADDAWHAALETAYGSQAVAARYEMIGPKGSPRRGTATPELVRLYAAYREAADDYWLAVQRARAQGSDLDGSVAR